MHPGPRRRTLLLARRYDWRTGAVVALVTSVVVIGFVVVVRDVMGWDVEEATRAPLAARGGPRYGGWFGSLGVLGWTVGAAVAAFGAHLAARRAQPGEARFLAGTAGLTTVLLLDDLFMVHHTVAPQLLGVPKGVVIAVIVVLGVGWGLVFLSRLLDDPDLPILVWAALWYGAALTIDAAGDVVGWGGVREEASKLIGVGSWAIFVWRTAFRGVTPDG